jgi:hypothetical protein
MAALRRLNRKQRRAGAQLLDGSRAYIRAAAESLGFSDEEMAEAQSGAGESADVLMARVFELLELQHGHSTPACDQARAEMEARRGTGFVKRVARMGKPATVALRALLATLVLLVLSLIPSRADAALAKLATLSNAHKIQRRNRRLLRPETCVRNFADTDLKPYHGGRGWIRSSRKSAGSARLSSSCRSSETGFGRGRASSGKRAKSSRSSWFGGDAASALATCPRVTRISQSSGETARWKRRPSFSSSAGAFQK